MTFNINAYHQKMLRDGKINRVFNAIENTDIPSIADYIADNDINAELLYGQTLLHYDCRKVNHQVATFLLQHGADPNKPSACGNGPLSSAIVFGDIPLIQLLLQHGVNVNGPIGRGSTPLILSVLSSQAKFDLLLASGADIHLTDNLKRTVLHEAAYYGCKTMVGILIKAGADPNVKDKNGYTAIDCATERGHNNIVKLLQIGRLTKPVRKS